MFISKIKSYTINYYFSMIFDEKDVHHLFC